MKFHRKGSAQGRELDISTSGFQEAYNMTVLDALRSAFYILGCLESAWDIFGETSAFWTFFSHEVHFGPERAVRAAVRAHAGAGAAVRARAVLHAGAGHGSDAWARSDGCWSYSYCESVETREFEFLSCNSLAGICPRLDV